MITVPADALCCAKMCEAKKDVRFYLMGIFISSKLIVATSGHVLYQYTLEGSEAEDAKEAGDGIILKIPGAVPVRAVTAEIDIKEDYVQIRYKNGTGLSIGMVVGELIDGKFPDIGRVTKIVKEQPEPCDKIAFNAGYLAKAEKIFKRINPKYTGVHVVLHGKENAAHMEFGNHLYIVMPMRL